MQDTRITLPNNLTIKYVESGSNEKGTVLFLHGYADSWRSYERILQIFPKDYRCYAIDLRGHGDSSKPECCYRMKDYAEDVFFFQNAMGIQTATLVGHSMGSFIGQFFAAVYPERTEKLVLISSSHKATENKVLTGIQNEIFTLQDPVSKNFIEEFQRPSLPVPHEFLQTMIAESQKIPAHIWKSAIEELLRVDHDALLESITAETLILWGAQDGIFRKDDQLYLDSKMRNSRLIEHEAGHALHWELPESVVSDIRQFLP